ncbi:MAG: CPBP family intramembrane glutamic endopeptidase [Rhizomicrobium sp.]
MADERDGTWRRYEFVRWTDVTVPVEAALVWLGLAIIAFAVALPILASAGVSSAQVSRDLPALLRQPVAAQLITATSDLVLVFFLWRIARRVADRAMVARYRAVPGWVLLLAALGGAAFAVLTTVALVQLYQRGLYKPHDHPNERMFAPGPAFQFPVILFTVAAVAPFVEEFYFRGIVLSWLCRKLHVVLAVFASAAIFALLHFRFLTQPGIEGWMLTGLIGMVGVVNATLALRTRSLWPPFAFHAAYNGTLAGVTIVPFLMAGH